MKKPVVVILLFIVGSILFYSAASLALSSPWGQGWWTGYFKGEHVPEYTSSGRLIVYDRVIDCGGANAFSESDFKPDLGQTAIKANFVSVIEKYRNGTKCSNYDPQDAVGADFLISVMLSCNTDWYHVHGNYCDNSKPHDSDVDNWANLITNSNDIRIVWDGPTSQDPNNPGYYFAWNSAYDQNSDDDFFLDEGGTAPALLVEAKINGSWKVEYAIKADCGNLVGNDFANTGMIFWNLSGDSDVEQSGGTTWSQNITVTPGTSVTFRHRIWNTGPGDMDRGFNSNIYWDGSTTGEISSTDHPALSVGSQTSNVWTRYYPGPASTVTWQVPPNAVNGSKYCQYITWTNDTNPETQSGDSSGDKVSEACVNVGAPQTSGTIMPDIKRNANTEAGSSAPFVFSVISNTAVPASGEYQISYTTNDPSSTYAAYNTGPTAFNVLPNQTLNLLNQTIPVTATLNPGTTICAELSLTAVGPAGVTANPPSQQECTTIYQVPYVRFYGNDIHATGGSEDYAGEIFFNTNPLSNGGGSGSQLAAIAETLINNSSEHAGGVGISSAVFRSGPPSSPYGLSAQIPADNISSAERDLTQYLPAAGTSVSSPFVINGNSTSAGYYTSNGDLSISGNGHNQSKITIYAAGNISITNNILNQVQPTEQYFQDSSAPVILIVAGGNIYIDSSVTEIDAILIANGTVYTCYDTADSQPIAQSNWQLSPFAGGCRNQLVINGAVGASTIDFDRSIGTRLAGNPSEGNGYTTQDSNQADEAAEVIDFPSYLYFATPYLNNSSLTGFQALFNAAPLL